MILRQVPEVPGSFLLSGSLQCCRAAEKDFPGRAEKQNLSVPFLLNRVLNRYYLPSVLPTVVLSHNHDIFNILKKHHSFGKMVLTTLSKPANIFLLFRRDSSVGRANGSYPFGHRFDPYCRY